MGEQIKYARLRRKLSMESVAERAGISRATLWAIERGTPSVSIGMYAAVLHALNNMDEEIRRRLTNAVRGCSNAREIKRIIKDVLNLLAIRKMCEDEETEEF